MPWTGRGATSQRNGQQQMPWRAWTQQFYRSAASRPGWQRNRRRETYRTCSSCSVPASSNQTYFRARGSRLACATHSPQPAGGTSRQTSTCGVGWGMPSSSFSHLTPSSAKRGLGGHAGAIPPGPQSPRGSTTCTAPVARMSAPRPLAPSPLAWERECLVGNSDDFGSQLPLALPASPDCTR